MTTGGSPQPWRPAGWPRHPGDDLDRWLDALAGRSPGIRPDTDSRQGHLLRQAVLREYAAADTSISDEMLTRTHRQLKLRLAREGLLQPRWYPGWWLPKALAAGIATAVIGFILIIPFQSPTTLPREEVFLSYGVIEGQRGPATQETVLTGDPDGESRLLASRLRDLDVPFELTTGEAGRERLLRMQPKETTRRPELKRELLRRGLTLPESGELTVRFSALPEDRGR